MNRHSEFKPLDYYGGHVALGYFQQGNAGAVRDVDSMFREQIREIIPGSYRKDVVLQTQRDFETGEQLFTWKYTPSLKTIALAIQAVDRCLNPDEWENKCDYNQPFT